MVIRTAVPKDMMTKLLKSFLGKESWMAPQSSPLIVEVSMFAEKAGVSRGGGIKKAGCRNGKVSMSNYI